MHHTTQCSLCAECYSSWTAMLAIEACMDRLLHAVPAAACHLSRGSAELQSLARLDASRASHGPQLQAAVASIAHQQGLAGQPGQGAHRLLAGLLEACNHACILEATLGDVDYVHLCKPGLMRTLPPAQPHRLSAQSQACMPSAGQPGSTGRPQAFTQPSGSAGTHVPVQAPKSSPMHSPAASVSRLVSPGLAP